MANALTRDHLTRLARLGAAQRLEELRQEEAAIRAAFPDLFRGGRGRRAAAASSTSTAEAAEEDEGQGRRRRRRRKGMTPEGRAAVSERMKRYWAERRKSKR